MAIVRVALPVAAHQLFDYWLPDGLALQPGAVVFAHLGKRRLPGVAVELIDTSDVSPERLLAIDEVVADLLPLPEDVRALANFVAGYYQEPIGQCYAQMLPPLTGARRGKRAPDGAGIVAPSRTLALNAAQCAAVDAAVPNPLAFAPSLLQGVTGSGKTEVYLAAVARVVAQGRQALLLVPEINLTPQLVERIANALPDTTTALLHSRLAAGERRRNWMAAASGEAQLVVGTRLAVFTPLPRLGLIVVDEEHDASFKQQDVVRYHARDVAVYRARLRDVPVLLGSATPSLESYSQARRGRYRWLKLAQRATAQTSLPPVRMVPNRTPDSVEGIGPQLQRALAKRLELGEQSLLFINRRGFAPSLLCVACDWKAMCPRCSARLVVHRDTGKLCCHHCGHVESIPFACPTCGNQDLLPLGSGTQRLENAVRGLYPQARVVRVDRDSTRRKGAFAGMRDAISAGDIDILIGTQMLAKGHDFPRLTLVGVLGADNALYSAEFRATERLFALLEQVSGRAGRGTNPGEVVVQTDFPEHPVYEALERHDFDRFAETLLAEREALGLPPFAHLALLSAEATQASAVNAFLAQATLHGRSLAAQQAAGCEVYAAVPAALARRAGLERAQVLAQSRDRRAFQEFLPRWRAALEQLGERRVRWSLDVDPLGFA